MPGKAAARPFRIGVISDTHGELPAAVEELFEGVDAIVHAGDVGGGLVLESLAAIAPVTVVRGNCDGGLEALLWPEVENIVLGGVRVLVAHRGGDLVEELAPARVGARIVIRGHTHAGDVQERQGVVWVNPGSASSPRGDAPASVALVDVDADGGVEARIVPLA
jgi:uncharacterized protein